jgi:hypothetical protein
MPLLDHFHSPFSGAWPWDGIHAHWAGEITGLLNAGPLPLDYHAIPLIKRDEADAFEVQVLRQLGRACLRAAVEIVSPANKDRPGSRRAFAVKCASYLQQSVSVVVIDVVTEQVANLHAELLSLLDITREAPWQSPTNLYAVAYRVTGKTAPHSLEIWCEPLSIGGALPTLPLWLETDLSVPVRLEESYQAARVALRIPG